MNVLIDVSVFTIKILSTQTLVQLHVIHAPEFVNDSQFEIHNSWRSFTPLEQSVTQKLLKLWETTKSLDKDSSTQSCHCHREWGLSQSFGFDFLVFLQVNLLSSWVCSACLFCVLEGQCALVNQSVRHWSDWFVSLLCCKHLLWDPATTAAAPSKLWIQTQILAIENKWSFWLLRCFLNSRSDHKSHIKTFSKTHWLAGGHSNLFSPFLGFQDPELLIQTNCDLFRLDGLNHFWTAQVWVWMNVQLAS